MSSVLLGVYAAGVLCALVVMRDRWTTRLVTALLWPLGPLAFVAVITILLAAAAYLWPLPVLTTAAVAGVVVWMLL